MLDGVRRITGVTVAVSSVTHGSGHFPRARGRDGSASSRSLTTSVLRTEQPPPPTDSQRRVCGLRGPIQRVLNTASPPIATSCGPTPTLVTSGSRCHRVTRYNTTSGAAGHNAKRRSFMKARRFRQQIHSRPCGTRFTHSSRVESKDTGTG